MAKPKVLGIVLAGGEGKRLWPLTADRAKPAVPFGGNFRLLIACRIPGRLAWHIRAKQIWPRPTNLAADTIAVSDQAAYLEVRKLIEIGANA